MNKGLLIILCGIFLILPRLMAAPVEPTKDGDIYTLSVANIEFKVNAEHGGKIISLTSDGVEFLMNDPALAKGVYFGSTLWSGPGSELGWTESPNGHWYPTPLELDTGSYSVILGDASMTFVSEIDEDGAGYSYQFVKTFSANDSDTSITLKYSLVNKSGENITKGLWALTRVPVGGLLVYPAGEDEPWDEGSGISDFIQLAADHYWYPFDEGDGSATKFFGNSDGGWYAYVNDSKQCFIKVYEDVDKDELGAGDDELEYWIDGDFNYVELENLSALKELADEDTVHYTVKWYLRDLPSEINANVGSTSLIDYLQKVMASGSELSLDKTDHSSDITLYPNPANNSLHVEGLKNQSSNIKLIDPSGRLIMSKVLIGKATLDISELKKGLYFYTVTSGGITQSGKIIKE